MRPLRKLRALTAGDLRWLARALPLVALVRLGLWVFPFRVVRRWQRGAAVRIAPPGDSRAAVEPIVRAVARAGRVVPGASCLTQALAAQRLLAWHGHRAEIRLGVARRDGARLAAHAWLELDGRIVLGGEGVGGFTPLPNAALGRCGRW